MYQLARDPFRLLDQHPHRQAPNQPSGPPIIVMMEAVEAPGSEDSLRLAQARRYPDDSIATGWIGG
jgi:hypothetical protein